MCFGIFTCSTVHLVFGSPIPISADSLTLSHYLDVILLNFVQNLLQVIQPFFYHLSASFEISELFDIRWSIKSDIRRKWVPVTEVHYIHIKFVSSFLCCSSSAGVTRLNQTSPLQNPKILSTPIVSTKSL
ncbi:hypothetical protein DFS33DRAFT_1314226 [Desarmillaria ectypa]|nr:hypothetical protein DFS33DRAFT_1314226 [Desarmillaria ectypa]